MAKKQERVPGMQDRSPNREQRRHPLEDPTEDPRAKQAEKKKR